mmetsp:Transcript_51638/g.148935  ORF Transcript_51638/g.148935 Transcript_51638/m.148935 type:complete len:255 (+) Transcript_51638:790-1554(+)
MQWKVVEQVAIVHELPHINTSAIVVQRPDDAVDQPDAIRRPEDGPRLWIRILPVLCWYSMGLVQVRNHASVAVVQLSPANIVVPVLRKSGEVLRLQLQLVPLRRRDLPQVRLVRCYTHKDLVPIAGVVQEEDKPAVAQRMQHRSPLGLPRLHLVPLLLGGRLQAAGLLLELCLAPAHNSASFVGEDEHNVRARRRARHILARALELGLLVALAEALPTVDICGVLTSDERHCAARTPRLSRLDWRDLSGPLGWR